MKCLILGGAGFIGSHILDALIERGHQLRVFDRPNINMSNLSRHIDHIEVYHGDFNNVRDIIATLHGIDVAVNLICTTLPGSSNDNPIYDVESNIKGNIFLLETALKMGVKKVVFASSGGTVYGIPKKLPVSETHPTDPLCSYGITKLTVEKYLHLFYHLYGLDYTVLRLGNPYGERQKIDGVQGAVAVFLGKVLKNLPIHIWGDGSVARDFIYVRDMVGAFVNVIENQTPSKIYNIGSGQSCTIRHLLEVIASVTEKKPIVVFENHRNLDVPEIALDIGKAGNEMGWRPVSSLESGIRATWKWLKEQYP
jgi:UDP-glucose 4-epimerase